MPVHQLYSARDHPSTGSRTLPLETISGIQSVVLLLLVDPQPVHQARSQQAGAAIGGVQWAALLLLMLLLLKCAVTSLVLLVLALLTTATQRVRMSL